MHLFYSVLPSNHMYIFTMCHFLCTKNISLDKWWSIGVLRKTDYTGSSPQPSQHWLSRKRRFLLPTHRYEPPLRVTLSSAQHCPENSLYHAKRNGNLIRLATFNVDPSTINFKRIHPALSDMKMESQQNLTPKQSNLRLSRPRCRLCFKGCDTVWYCRWLTKIQMNATLNMEAIRSFVGNHGLTTHIPHSRSQ
jgi:hypothetical protein